jgi:CBS domain-containing protein
MIVGNVCQSEAVTIGSDETLSVAAHLMRERHVGVADVMTRSPLLGNEGHSIEATLRFMRDLGVRRVPVVGSRGQLTGVLSLDDVLDAFASQLANMAGAIRNEQNRERATRS